jgi:N-acetylglucosamine-6-sulfatase
MLSRRSLLAAPLLQAQRRRPNIVFVLVDDLRWDELGCTGHPFAQTPNVDRLAREGALFRNAFATTPLCSPSRATFLTGLYPRANGIVDNTDRSAASHKLVTWPRLLRDTGYETAFIGKWHMGNDDSPRPGFDHWVSFPGQGESTDPPINENGTTTKLRGYITDILTQKAVDVIRRPRSKPLCLYLAHKAIHPNIQQAADGSVTSFGRADEFIVADRHKSLYKDAKLPRRGNYARPPKGKPALERSLPSVRPLGPDTATDDATILNRMRMTKAIDEGVGRMVEALRESGQLDDTLFVFTSDHGYFYGEHGLNPERRLAYEETIRIPLVVRYPRRIRPGTVVDKMVASIDIAPTMLELGGARAGARAAWNALAGRSLVPLIEGRGGAWRDALLFEYHSDRVFPRIKDMGYRAIRTERFKYIHYLELPAADELYDLRADPFELNNIVGSCQELGSLKAALAELIRQTEPG